MHSTDSSQALDAELIASLLQQARRLSLNRSAADDLVQEVLLIAWQQGRNERAWLNGVMRRQAAMRARGGSRRRRREQQLADQAVESVPNDEAAQEASNALLHDILAAMSPAARRVAVLVLHGLNGKEVCWLLQLSNSAFRQRLTSIRRAVGKLPDELRAQALALAYVRDPERSVDLQYGLVRRALLAALRNGPGADTRLGTHDLDGHLLVIDRGHKKGN